MKIRKFMQSFRLMTVIAAAAGFVACQENTVDTQGEILPKLATDAQNTYVADPTLPENITFNVSSNTPWRITVDCGEGFAERPWCSVSPSLSAVSSLVEVVTIKMKDNPTYESRTAAITIEADGIAEPTVITVRQTGQGNLTLSELQPREEISKDGGSASFTVVSNRDWTAESDQKWLTLDKSSGTASDDPITVTVTASVSDGLRRTAVVTVRTDLETETIEVVQEGWRMEFRPLENPETELFFGYAGDTKTYYVDANVEWTVSSENAYAVVEKIDEESFSVKLPFARAFADEEIAIVLKAAAENSPIETQTMTVTQETAVTPESGQLDGNTLTATAGNARVKSKGEYKYGEFIWKFSEVNLESGYFSINNWAGSVYLMLRFGSCRQEVSLRLTDKRFASVLTTVGADFGMTPSSLPTARIPRMSRSSGRSVCGSNRPKEAAPSRTRLFRERSGSMTCWYSTTVLMSAMYGRKAARKPDSIIFSASSPAPVR